MNLEDRVRRTIRQRALAGPGTRVIAALSGGSDSVALVHLLEGLHRAGDLRLVALAHFNHQLRPEADADQAFCAGIGRRLNLPLIVGGADVPALARRHHRSVEDAARTARHAFLEHARVEAAAETVALGHTRDDQAETFLLRLLRGAGSQGLASMYPRNGAIIRPLIDCRRDELVAYLAARGHTFVVDASNSDLTIPRNRVRAELLPFLAARFNPSVVDALADAAEIARADWTWLNEAAEELERRAARPGGEFEECDSLRNESPDQSRIEHDKTSSLTIDLAEISGAPVAVARALLRRLMTQVSAGRFVGFEAVERALELSRGAGSDFDAPGQRVQRIGSTLVLTGRPLDAVGRSWRAGARLQQPVGDFRYPLSIPGEVELNETGCVISAEEVTAMPAPAEAVLRDDGQIWARQMPLRRESGVAPEGEAVVVRRDLCGSLLAVRNRRPGDRFRPAGLRGRKKLQDYFVDRKVARRLRDRVPLVVDEADRIVWVAGYAMNDEFRVTHPAQAVIILRLKGVGGAV